MPSGVFYFNIYTHNAINYHTRQHAGLLCLLGNNLNVHVRPKKLAIKGCNWNFKSSSEG